MRVHVGVFTRHTIHTAPAVHVGFRYLRVGPPQRSSGKKKLELIEVARCSCSLCVSGRESGVPAISIDDVDDWELACACAAAEVED